MADSVTRCEALVLGAGITGLSCAWRMAQAGIDVRVVEKGTSPGGVIRSERRGGWLLEKGPQSCSLKPELADLVQEAGLGGRIIVTPQRDHPRFVMTPKGLVEVPRGPLGLLTSPLLSTASLLRMLMDPFQFSKLEKETSVADFVRGRFGPEVLQNLVGPFVSGIYAGDPETLSFQGAFPLIAGFAKSHGSLLRGALSHFRRLKREKKKEAEEGEAPSSSPPVERGLCSFPEGLAELPMSLAKKLWNRMSLGVEAAVLESLRSGKEPLLRLSGRDGKGKTRVWEAGMVVMATPAAPAVGLLGSLAPDAAQALTEMTTSPLLLCHVGVSTSAFSRPPRGFGFLAARNAGVRLLGALFSSSVLPGRAPEGRVLLTLYYGGALDPRILELDDEALAATVSKDLEKALGWDGSREFLEFTRVPSALPAYLLGHPGRVSRVKESIKASGLPLVLAGNFMEGISLPDCVRQGFSAADSVLQALRPEAASGPIL